jgi:hypothetical protein
MTRRGTVRCVLFGVPEIGLDGKETRVRLGEIRACVSSRSAKESTDRLTDYAAETAALLIPSRCAPPGGFLRGMSVAVDGGEYRMLTPVRHGRFWSVKCVRMHV